MLTKNLTKIDRFFGVTAVVLLILTFLLIFTLKGILSSIITANEIDEEAIGSIPVVNGDQLNKALEYTVKKEVKPLDLRE